MEYTKDEELVDVLQDLKVEKISVLDDGFVRLVDVMPRLVPKGRGLECAIVKTARVSYGQGLKTPEVDAKLVKYLIEHQHTSPLEHVEFVFHIRIPIVFGVHFLRHRTANVNQFSQRYAEINDNAYYHLSHDYQNTLRLNSKTNKQASVPNVDNNEDKNEKLKKLVEQSESLVDELFQNYHKMIELGLAKEQARVYLPSSCYTEMYYKMDLNNLLKLLRLRMDSGAQYETRQYANAMYELIKPLLPNVFEVIKL
ncbi:Thymidylate synthase ThyX [Orpheovirus IHUMI-LCC2]|uniref:Thymidylate synthase ThyX n=1 Tax=Orpheovirus IHUMI-LCC2 TaxID=2023057 RepID=A0A2I2L3D0_9VIRU|nr:Thymidylate synthase ThyX [Orpheovirus IHUMI-LCC2]SNW62031.1 Thymidylate synthase ThyX [Orpheovirus IHUMI-LCC2]